MTSLPVSVRPRPFGTPDSSPALRWTDNHRRRVGALPAGAVSSALTLAILVGTALLVLLCAALLLVAFWRKEDSGLAEPWLQGSLLAGLLALWGRLRGLSRAQAREAGLARRDELTGLPNRRALNEHLQVLLGGQGERAPGEEALRGRGPSERVWSVLLIDVDHFKAVNDRYGHLAGDEVLKALTLSLRQELRSDDLLGRWGGEEFLALLPTTPFEGALVAAERLRRSMSLRTFPYAGSVTVSIGVASRLSGDTLERVVARADSGMYAAKRGGRNRVAFSE